MNEYYPAHQHTQRTHHGHTHLHQLRPRPAHQVHIHEVWLRVERPQARRLEALPPRAERSERRAVRAPRVHLELQLADGQRARRRVCCAAVTSSPGTEGELPGTAGARRRPLVPVLLRSRPASASGIILIASLSEIPSSSGEEPEWRMMDGCSSAVGNPYMWPWKRSLCRVYCYADGPSAATPLRGLA